MLKILIVDDEQVVRVYLQNIVNWEEYGCDIVTTCENGLEALEVMEQQPIDLLLTGLNMPMFNGLSLLEEINSRGYHTKVIVLSHQSDYGWVRQALKLGAFDYYIKSRVTKEYIISAIDRASKELKKQFIEREKSESFRVGRQTFLMTVLTGDVYYSDDELEHYIQLYHLFEPRFSLFQLRFYEPIDSKQLAILDDLIKVRLNRYDYDIVHLTNDKVLVMIYEQTYIEDPELMDCWFNVVKEMKNHFKRDVQASKRLMIDSASKLTTCKKLFKEESKKEVSPAISQEEFSHYRPEIQNVLNYIHEHYDERITLQDLAVYACLNEAYLSRLFKAETKKTINSYINELRIYKAKELLKIPDIMIKEVAQLVGIKDQLYFNRVFKKFCGENPTHYQERIKKVYF